MVMYFKIALISYVLLVAGPGSKTTGTRNNVLNTKWLIKIKMAGKANPGRSPLNGNQIETSRGDGDDTQI